MERKIIDYCTIAMTMETRLTFFDEVLSDQNNFNNAVIKKMNEGFVPVSDAKITPGTSGSLFSSGDKPMISQTLVKYE